MILYHGSNIEIKRIDLSKCRSYKDFGRGFYLTSIKEQAEIWAKRVSRIFSGESWITVYEFDESVLSAENLSIKVFDEPSSEWAMFVLNNRNRKFTDLANVNSNHDNKYDIVIGAVADDDIALQLRQLTGGFIDTDALAKAMKYRKLNNQYSFHTQNAVNHLTKTGAWYCE
ncbi:MAG: DUF3990 domain-containing protein [Oscillospiraceae bacterium]|nr:DUF3990 domain-containing protein [Oscillospiraceae bacterium]